MRISELKTGDIIAISRPKGFLPKAIQFFMKLWARIHYNTSLGEYYNHTMVVVNTAGLEVAEAIGKGFVIHSIFSKYRQSDFIDMIVFRPIIPLNFIEKRRLREKAIALAKKNVEYEVLNFFWWVPYILSNGKIDLSPRTAKKGNKLFCFEASALLFQAARPFTFKKPDKVTTVDLQMNKAFKQHYIEFKLH